MVYESDFYTTRRPYRSTPAYSSYTSSQPPSRQVRILPGLGKVHVVHTYDRIVPYVGHKRLTVVTLPPRVYSTRSSVLQREYDWIENKVRPWVAYSPTNRYLNSDSSVRYVYVQNPISGLKYHTQYDPSQYYNFYRITRPLVTYDDDYWPYYWPYYYKYLPRYSTLNYVDDLSSVSKSLKVARKKDYYAELYNSYYRWLNSYHYYKYCKPHSLRNRLYWSDYLYDYYFYFPSYRSSLLYPYNWSFWRYYLPLGSWYLKDSYYWLRRRLNYNNLDNLTPYSYKYLLGIFDDEKRLIRAQTASLLKQIHLPVPRLRSWPITPLNRHTFESGPISTMMNDSSKLLANILGVIVLLTHIKYGDFPSLPAKYSNDTYIHRLLTVSPNSKISCATYYTEPVKKYIGAKGYSRRQPLAIYEDALKNDIQLLSYYINKFREEKGRPKEIQAPLSASRPSRIFSVHKPIEDPVVQEIKDLREARAARLAKIYESDDKPATNVETNLKTKQKKEETRLAEENAIAEEKARKEAQAKKEEAARQAELVRQEQLAAQAAAERAAELEKQAEKARQEELAKQAELEKARKEEEARLLLEEETRRQEEERLRQEEERLRQEEQKRLEEEAKAEEERQQLLRLEEIARQAEEEKERELARQAEELAELAKQEAERAEQERKEQEQKEAELAELARQEAELAELERQEKELAEKEAELVKDDIETVEKSVEDSEAVTQETEKANTENLEIFETDKEDLALPDQDVPLKEDIETQGEQVLTNLAGESETETATDEKEITENVEEEQVVAASTPETEE